MKNIAAFALLSLMILGCSQPPEGGRAPVDSTSQAVVTCKKTQATPPFLCIDYAFTDPPAGFQDCAGDNNTYDGEITLHDFVNFSEECIWAHPSTGTCLGWPQMKDWNGASGHLQTRSAVSRLHTVPGFALQLYSAANFGGSVVTAPTGPSGSPLTNTVNTPWLIQSGNACNVY